jgi:TolB-like protein
MSDDDFAARIRRIFDEVVDLDPEARAARLAETCGADDVLRRQVQSLVAAAHEHGAGVQRALNAMRPVENADDDPSTARGDISSSLASALKDRYVLGREIGRGGMATVYVAEDLKHHRQVALKVLDPELSAAVGTRRFLREIEVAANLRHPHILPLFDSGEAAGLLYYVMPRIEGESLRARLKRERQLPVEDAISIAREIADALEHAHERAIIHRDVKPANIMLEAGHAVLADFGIAAARVDATAERLTRTGMSPGTPTYMSPEQISGEHELDGRSDQYSLACVLYEMLAGEPPFRGPGSDAMVRQHLTVDPTPVTRLRTAVPAGVASALARALAKNPADRFRAMHEFRAALTDTSGRERIPGRRWQRSTAAVLALLTIGVASGILARQLAPSDSDVIADRVAVAPLRNLTGRDSLAVYGTILAEGVISGLARTGRVNTVPIASVLSAAGDGSRFEPNALGQATEAGLIIHGSYFLHGDSIVIQPQIIDVTGDAGDFPPLDSIIVPSGHLMAGRQLLLDRVMAALSTVRHPLLADANPPRDLPSTMPAYRAYFAGRVIHNDSTAAAVAHYEDAVALDSTFTMARLWLAGGVWNATGNVPRTDSILRIVEARKDDLPPDDRAVLDWLRAWTDGDRQGALDAASRMAELYGPRSGPAAAAVQAGLMLNHLDEAYARMTRILESPHRRRQPGMWTFMADVLHARGQFRRELQAVRDGSSQGSSDSSALLVREIRALAALGQVDTLRVRLEQARRRGFLFDDRNSTIFRDAAGELRAHDRAAQAQAQADSFGRLAVTWYREALRESSTYRTRFNLAAALFDLGEPEADTIFEALVGDGLSPEFNYDHAEGYDAASLGYLGLSAARRADTDSAEAIILQLGAFNRRFMFGAGKYWQARIAAQLGDCKRAVDFLQGAVDEGSSYTLISETPPFTSLTCPEYQRFMRPRK